MLSALSLTRQMDILSKVAQLAEDGHIYAQDLVNNKFSAFLLNQSFAASFCKEDEIAIHHQYLIEIAKIYIGTPSGIPGHLALQRPDAFRSEFIERLRVKRDDENGVLFGSIPVTEEWRQQLDPCIRRQFQTYPNLVQQPPSPAIDMLQSRQRFREEEASIHRTGLGDDYGDTPTEWVSFWLELMQRYLGNLGFAHNAKRSSPFLPVYSKHISPIWDLCFALESADDIRLQIKYAHEYAKLHTHFRVELSIRTPGKKPKKPLATRVWADKMVIRYASLVPSFEWAYNYFSNFDQWEAATKAYAHLYKLISAPLEKILVQELN